MQIVVWGESGAGKSSLINKALLAEGRAAVSTSCTPESAFEGILSDALVSTGAFYVSERGEDSDGSFSASIQGGGEIIGAKGKLKERLAQRASVKKQLIAPPDMTVRTLFYALGQYNLSWVIEDYHKMSTKERGRLAHALKVFSDHGGAYRHTQVIILGVAESVDELVGGSANLANRVMDVQVPPLSKSELGEILDLGGKILNVDFSVVRARLIEMSVGTASITHALALGCCDEREVTYECPSLTCLSNRDLSAATASYVRTHSGRLKPRFDNALTVYRKRKYENPVLIIRALAELPEEGGSVGEILEIIRRDHPEYPSSNATNYLDRLQRDECGGLVRMTSLKKYRFDEPMQHAYAKMLFGLSLSEGTEEGLDSGVTWGAALARLQS